MTTPFPIDLLNSVPFNDNGNHNDDDDDDVMSLISIHMGDDSSAGNNSKETGNIKANRERSRSREMIEKRRRRQAQEAQEMLGMIESISDDDESYVQDTLASLEYSTTTAGSSSFLKELVETTAPYNMPQWQFFVRKWSRRIAHNRTLKRYGPWMAMLFLYISCRLVSPSGQPAATATTNNHMESMTLKVYRDSVLNQLQSNVNVGDLHDTINQGASASVFRPQHNQFSPPLPDRNHRIQKSLAPDNAMNDEDPIVEEQQIQQRKQYHVENSARADEDPMALPPSQQEQIAAAQMDPNFQERVNQLKELTKLPTVDADDLQQQQQQQPLGQPNPLVDAQQLQLLQHNNDVPPADYWKPRKRGENKVKPSNLISAGLV